MVKDMTSASRPLNFTLLLPPNLYSCVKVCIEIFYMCMFTGICVCVHTFACFSNANFSLLSSSNLITIQWMQFKFNINH